ncbi:TfpX/TfpZ family type IV pilin accessory protein [Dyella sp. 20L07]|uniref:TfpX/TfpZ family type IV pilin accessory protein n=1 Tax=Dyella sp. 20L07 TaxID=3384240 RepID=UPI003D2BC241
MSRWKAASIHLAISFALALGVAGLLYFLWFPQPYFIAAGATGLMLLIISVDVVIGPALTLVVFNGAKPKRELCLDLSIIGVLQAIAFAYGLFVICQARPIFVVAAVDRLNVVMANELTDADLAKGRALEFRRRSWTGPTLIGAKPDTTNTIELALQALSGGKDIDRLPQYYVSYEQVADNLLARAHPLSMLKGTTPAQQSYIQKLTSEAKGRGDALVYVPLQARKIDYAAVISTRTKRPLAILAANPW